MNTNERQLEKILKQIKSGNLRKERKAIKKLVQFKDSKSIGPLITALQDKDSSIRKLAIRTLGRLKNEIAIDPMIDVLKEDQDKKVKYILIEVLASFQTSKVVDAFINLVKDDSQDIETKGAIIEALSINKELDALLELMQEKNEWTRESASVALEEIGDKTIVEPLIKLLQDGKKWVREEAAYVLSKLEDPRAINPLIDVLSDENKLVRQHAVDGLGNLHATQAIGPLNNLLLNEPDDYVKRSAKYVIKLLEKKLKE